MRRYIATFCLLMAVTVSARASGFSIYEASVRANAMLGAFSAYADHVSTIYYNPAGLAKLDGFRFSGGATIIAPRSTFRGPLPSSTPFPSSQGKYKMDKQNFLVPNVYASYQIQDGLTVGLGTYVPFGLGTRWDSNWAGRTKAIDTEVQTLFLQPTIGYTLPDMGIGKIHVGAGLMIAAYGHVKLSRAVEDFAVSDDIFSLEGDLDKPAFGYNLGILYEPTDQVRLGFTYRSEVETKFKGDANFGGLPTAAFPTGTTGSTTLTLPSSWVAALNVRPMDNLTLEVDYVWWGWSSYDKLVINFSQTVPALITPDNPQGKVLPSERGYRDSWQLRGGVEYSDFGVEGLTVRGGLAYDATPLPEKYMDPTLPDSDRLLFSGGVSYDLTDYLAIDASYIFIRAKERKNTTSVNGFHGVYNTYANLPSLGITMKF